jgi:hypothetical protein
MFVGRSYTVLVIVVTFLKIEFLRQIIESPELLNFTKIHPVGAKLFHADWRTDRRTKITKLRVAFRNFAKAPTNGLFKPVTPI